MKNINSAQAGHPRNSAGAIDRTLCTAYIAPMVW